MLVEDLIESIRSLTAFRPISYYTYHLGRALWRNFTGPIWKGVPYCLKSITDDISRLIKQSEISQGEIIQYIALDDNYFFVIQNILIYGTTINLNDLDRYAIASNQMPLPSDAIIIEDILSCVVACYALELNRYNDWNFNNIILEEQFIYPISDYKLTVVKNVDFRQHGFIFDNKYYLYNIFIDRRTLMPGDNMPAVFRIIIDNIDLQKADLLMRLDERLSVPINEADILHLEVAEKFRGPTFSFANTKLSELKNIIVHYNPETFDKLLMVIKKDFDKQLNEEFWHIEVEQLPYVDTADNNRTICTTFIHGKYYPNRLAFRHIDYIKNQYPAEEYYNKHNDRSNHNIQIDYYTTKECHYKIWCIENIDIAEDLWYKLISISLSEKYRGLFNEMLRII